jgi:hypothetical protein
MYDGKTALVANPINRYLINSLLPDPGRTGRILTIYVQRTARCGKGSTGSRPGRLSGIELYWPKEEALTESGVLLAVTLVKK